MQSYIIRRMLLMIPTFLIVTIMVFAMVRFVPGSIIDIMLSEMGLESGGAEGFDREALEHALGLDANIFVQYGRWLGVVPMHQDDGGGFDGLFQGSLGNSLWKHTSVLEEIKPRIPVTIELGVMAILVSIMIGIPIGIFSAIRQDTAGDYIGRTFAILCIAVPSIWVAILVMVFPQIWWGWAPRVQYIPLSSGNITGNLLQFIIPAAIMGMAMSGGLMRMTRTTMLEALRADYIRTAWAKGLRERVVITRHAMKNALIPVVTMIGMSIPMVVSAGIIIELIFALPGLGRLLMESITRRDYAIVSGVNVLLASLILVNNLIIDLSYAFLDPRIRYK